MSERSSFTSEYIYDQDTYKAVRSRLGGGRNGKYLCIAPAPSYEMGGHVFDLPIISGKIGTTAPYEEWLVLDEVLGGLATRKPVRFVIVCDSGPIQLVIKQADGEVEVRILEPEKD